MNNLNKILTIISSRSIDENLRDLIEVTNNNHYRLRLISYNSLLSDFFGGTVSKSDYDVEKAKLWSSLFFFLEKEPENNLVRILAKLASSQQNGHRTTILYAASSPQDAPPLQVGYEYDRIREAIEAGSRRDEIELLPPIMATTIERFLNDKYKYRPSIIHFSGHAQSNGLLFSTETNFYKEITEDLLKEIFNGIGAYARCIVLNACYAANQAKSISQQGPYVLGMNAPITDDAAIFLSKKFYRALSEGQDIEDAFSQTKTLLLDEFRNESKIPELWKNGVQIQAIKPS